MATTTGIHLRLIDVIEEEAETGELTVEYGSQLQTVEKGSSHSSVRFQFSAESGPLRLTYQTHEQSIPEIYESRFVDLANLNTTESNFLKLNFSSKS